MLEGIGSRNQVIHMSATFARVYDASESFGQRLRRERERRQISLTSIAETSKISVSLLQDLERDDVSKWPPAIYRRSFFRAYAAAVGLDVEAATREFFAAFPDPEDPDRLNPKTPTAPASPLRLTLAETETSFAPRRIFALARVRVLATACDLAVISMVGLAIDRVLKVLWMPLCLVTLGYYAGSILLLGTTPGVRLWTRRRPRRSPGDTRTSHRIWSALQARSQRPAGTSHAYAPGGTTSTAHADVRPG